MDSSQYFSIEYASARELFLKLAERAAASLESFEVSIPLESRSAQELVISNLTIDAATIRGENSNRVVVVTSGLHGVEGFVGSAIQSRILDELIRNPDQVFSHSCRPSIVLIHAINPFGFANVRRTDEANVDLNRNFLSNAETYQGCPPGYEDLNSILNPESAPELLDLFPLHCLTKVFKHGMPVLKNIVAAGQYDFPKGLFFGGKDKATATEIIQREFPKLVGDTKEIILVDIHSGLGKFGKYKLLVAELPDSEKLAWYHETFEENSRAYPTLVEPVGNPSQTAYKISGSMHLWLKQHYEESKNEVAFRNLAIEFGTHNVFRVLGALRNENRAYFWASPDQSCLKKAKREMMECFCPKSADWRNSCVENGLSVFQQAIRAPEIS